ncbi:Hypothetical predicted protein [Pelobates cultripes]|uniref:SprT-like domain-containing protein n=1 Tax=Pelobates cultripes TaxID=61616 RepID=A0AAD1WM67_PELCU|nr:Hypothetical predicted protein [Pelobates cultripes]
MKVHCGDPNCFLADLSSANSVYVKKFKRKKKRVGKKALPDDLEIQWNKRLTKTAGLCKNDAINIPYSGCYSVIQLSDKVCDSADRVRDTLIHEVCHAAAWLINKVPNGHGLIWKYYAMKATALHPELPKITQYHNYQIHYKYIYQCSGCKRT